MFLDMIDLQILNILKENARLRLKEIASRLNLTPTTIKYRIDRLVECGIINKFTISIDYRKVGYEIIAYLVVYAISKIHIANIIEHLKRYPEISKISVLMGNPDLIADLTVSSMNTLIDFLKNVSQIGEIQTFKTWFVMKIY